MALKITTESIIESQCSQYEHHFSRRRVNTTEENKFMEYFVSAVSPPLHQCDGILRRSLRSYLSKLKKGGFHSNAAQGSKVLKRLRKNAKLNFMRRVSIMFLSKRLISISKRDWSCFFKVIWEYYEILLNLDMFKVYVVTGFIIWYKYSMQIIFMVRAEEYRLAMYCNRVSHILLYILWCHYFRKNKKNCNFWRLLYKIQRYLW